MHIFARCGEVSTLTLTVPAKGSFADVRAALLAKRPKLAACDDLVSPERPHNCLPHLLHRTKRKLTSATSRMQAFTYGGRLCDDGVSLAAAAVQRDSTVEVQRRLRGGGGDGGATGAESRSSYLEMYMSKKPDKVRTPVQQCCLF